MGRIVAVTGAAGNLGRLVVDRLLAAESVERVLALDRREIDRSHPKLTSAIGDVRDPALDQKLAGVDAVVHLAFIVERGSRDEKLTEEVNIGGTRNVAAAVAKAGVKQLVYASSVASYGFRAQNDGVEITEEAPLHGDEGFYYPRHKAITDRLLAEFADAHPDIAVARMRPSIFIGPKTDPARVAALRAPLFFYPSGTDLPVQVTHEDDVADAFVLALEKEARGAFNVAAGEPLPFSRWGAAMGKPRVRLPDLAVKAFELAYRRGIGDVDPAWLHDTSRHELIVSSAKLRSELGWAPRFDSTGAVLRAIARRPTAAAGAGTRVLFGGLVRTTRLLGGIPIAKRDKAELRGVTGTLNLVLTGDHPSEWHVRIANQTIGFHPGLDPAADGTAMLKESVLFDMLSGKITFMRAQMAGRVRYRGDGNLSLFLGAIIEGFRQARHAKGLVGFPSRAFTRFVLRRGGVKVAPAAPKAEAASA